MDGGGGEAGEQEGCGGGDREAGTPDLAGAARLPPVPRNSLLAAGACRLPPNLRWLQGTYSSRIEDLADLRSDLKLGDIVRVQGRLSGSNEVQATAISVVEAWRDSHPGQTFRPRPSPLHSSGAQQGQEQQQQPSQQGQQERQQQQDGLQPPAASRAWQHSSPQADSAIAAALAAAGGASPNPSTVAVAAATAGAGAAAAAAPLCKAFVNTGSCAKGDACRFAHVHTGALRQQWVADR